MFSKCVLEVFNHKPLATGATYAIPQFTYKVHGGNLKLNWSDSGSLGGDGCRMTAIGEEEADSLRVSSTKNSPDAHGVVPVPASRRR